MTDASEAGRALQAQRKTFGAGPGRPRKVKHNPKDPGCRCVECRKDRGQYPETKSSNKLKKSSK